MAVQREKIYTALFARLETVGFTYFVRGWQPWDEETPSQSPCAYLVATEERHAVSVPGLPPLIELRAALVIYVANGIDPLDIADIALNNLLDKVDASLERSVLESSIAGAQFPSFSMGGTWGTTLGGLVYGCQRVDTTQIYEGVVGGWGVAVVPIQMLTTSI